MEKILPKRFFSEFGGFKARPKGTRFSTSIFSHGFLDHYFPNYLGGSHPQGRGIKGEGRIATRGLVFSQRKGLGFGRGIKGGLEGYPFKGAIRPGTSLRRGLKVFEVLHFRGGSHFLFCGTLTKGLTKKVY